MTSKIDELKKDVLVRGSFVLLVLIVLSNLLNYLFQIIMAKSLGPSDYSILAVLMSIVYVFTIPNEAIQTAITRYTSIFNTHGKNGKIKDLFIRSLRKAVFFAFICFIIYAIFSIFLASFLNIPFWLVLLTGLYIFIVFIIPVIRGVIQGKKKFTQLGSNLALESLLKVVLSVLFVWIGFRVYGAIGAVILSSTIAIFLALLPIREVIASKSEREEFTNIYHANVPLLVAMISIVLMYSVDIILARRFFTPQVAGEFAFVSLIGKVIIFVSSSIGKAMFPISSEHNEMGKNTSKLLNKSLLLVSLLALASLILYFAIPQFIIRVISLGSTQYLGASSVLFILGLAYSLISLTYIIVLYKLSVNKMRKSAYVLLLFAILEIVLLLIFNKGLFEFSIAILVSSLVMFLYSLFLIKR